MYWLFVYVYKYNFSQTTIVKSQSEFSDLLEKQKCIPVGCVTSAAVAVCCGVSARRVSAWGGVCPGGVSPHALRQTPPGQILDTRF